MCNRCNYNFRPFQSRSMSRMCNRCNYNFRPFQSRSMSRMCNRCNYNFRWQMSKSTKLKRHIFYFLQVVTHANDFNRHTHTDTHRHRNGKVSGYRRILQICLKLRATFVKPSTAANNFHVATFGLFEVVALKQVRLWFPSARRRRSSQGRSKS